MTVAGVQEKDSNHTQQEEQEEGPVATETSEGTTTESTDAIELNVTKVCNNTAPEEIVEVSEAAEEKNASTAYDAELLIRSKCCKTSTALKFALVSPSRHEGERRRAPGHRHRRLRPLRPDGHRHRRRPDRPDSRDTLP